MRGKFNTLFMTSLLLVACGCEIVEVCPDIDDCFKPKPEERAYYRLSLTVLDIDGNVTAEHSFARVLEDQGPWCQPAPEIGADALYVGAPEPQLLAVLDGRGYQGDPACQAFEQRVIMTEGVTEILVVDVDLGDPWLHSFHTPCPGLACEASGLEYIGDEAPGVSFYYEIELDAASL